MWHCCVSAAAIPAMLTLATDLLRFPPLDGSAPVSASASETPRAFAFKATASPLNVVVPCAKPKGRAEGQKCCQTGCDHRYFVLVHHTPSLRQLMADSSYMCVAARAPKLVATQLHIRAGALAGNSVPGTLGRRSLAHNQAFWALA